VIRTKESWRVLQEGAARLLESLRNVGREMKIGMISRRQPEMKVEAEKEWCYNEKEHE